MEMTQEQISKIVAETLRALKMPAAGASGNWLCDSAEEAIENAKKAQLALMDMTPEKRLRAVNKV